MESEKLGFVNKMGEIWKKMQVKILKITVRNRSVNRKRKRKERWSTAFDCGRLCMYGQQTFYDYKMH